MLKYLLTVCLLLVSSLNYAQANQANVRNHENSIYVAPQKFSKVYFQVNKLFTSNNQMFLEIDDTIIPIHAIFNDNVGAYAFIEVEELQAGPMGTWTCPRCFYANSIFKSTCQNCDWPNEDKRTKKNVR